MIKEFNSLEEIEKYYNKETNTYIFKENNQFIDLVVFNFDLNINANISAWDINACDISARDINACNISAKHIDAFDISTHNIRAWNIDALNIKANDINAYDIRYYAVCFAYNNIFCKTIMGRRENAKHFVLDGVLEVE